MLAQIWNWSNFSCNICGCCMMLQSFGQVRATMLRLSMRTSSIFNSKHAATRRNMVAKRTQHVAPNNVLICCVQMLRSFGRSLQMLCQQCWDMFALRSCYRLAGAINSVLKLALMGRAKWGTCLVYFEKWRMICLLQLYPQSQFQIALFGTLFLSSLRSHEWTA